MTAAHLVKNEHNRFEIYFDKTWHNFEARQRHFDESSDLAIFDFPADLMSPPSYLTSANAADYYIGQHVFFLGYPLGDFSILDSFGEGKRPLPFVKWGAISSSGFGKARNRLILDAYNVDGFSGGPILINRADGSQLVVGVVTHSQEISKPIENLNKGDAAKGFFVFQNAGLLRAVSAVAIIEAIETLDQQA